MKRKKRPVLPSGKEQLTEALLHMYHQNRVAVVDEVNGELVSVPVRTYVMRLVADMVH